jgi:hypothetical protein
MAIGGDARAALLYSFAGILVAVFVGFLDGRGF